jgi:hypothetical protein
VERLAREQGLEQGLLEGIEAVLRTRFGSRSESILAAIRQLSNVEILGQVLLPRRRWNVPRICPWYGQAQTKGRTVLRIESESTASARTASLTRLVAVARMADGLFL